MSLARTYLDHNATTPLRPVARDAMLAALETWGNPSSVHAEGRRARDVVENAREQVAALVGAKPSEVVFTSGATEANAWVLADTWRRVLVSRLEHDSVLAPLRRGDCDVVDLPVGRDGVVDVAGVAAQLAVASDPARTLLVLQAANNETGVLQPVTEFVALAAPHNIPVHCDAVQAAGRIAVDFAGLGVTYLSLSAHKIGGPKGIGALVVRDGTALPPLIAGGQERRRRGGTENVPAIAGFGAAAAEAARLARSPLQMASLRDRLEREIRVLVPDVVILGETALRLPNTCCLALPGYRAETLVIRLDLMGVAVSAGAACSSGKVGASHVLAAMGVDSAIARGAIRVSLGGDTTEADVTTFVAAIRAIAARPSPSLAAAAAG